MNGFQKTIAAVLLAAVLLFMIYLPKCAGKMLERDQYREWLEPEEEEFSGVINVVRFKPYMGSVGAWLKKIADRAERRHFGVFFEVESISEAEAESRLQNGEFPDVISFPAGFLNGRELRIMNGTEIFGIDGTAVDFGDGYGAGELPAGFDCGMDGRTLRALPFAAGCKLALFYPERVTAAEMTEILKPIAENAKPVPILIQTTDSEPRQGSLNGAALMNLKRARGISASVMRARREIWKDLLPQTRQNISRCWPFAMKRTRCSLWAFRRKRSAKKWAAFLNLLQICFPLRGRASFAHWDLCR